MMSRTPLVALPMAMVNDMHFWGLRVVRVAVLVVQPPNGDEVITPHHDARRRKDTKFDEEGNGEVDLNAWHQETLVTLRPRMPDDDVQREFHLCECLMY